MSDAAPQALESDNLDALEKSKYMTVLRKLCVSCGILPASHILPDGLDIIGNQPHMAGGFGEVWLGTYKGRQVAVKVLRTYTTDDQVKVHKVSDPVRVRNN